MTSEMDTASVLEKAAELLEEPGAWTQGALGRDVDGDPVVVPQLAACMCVHGALAKAAGKSRLYLWPTGAVLALQEAVRANVVAWNDAPGRTQAEVVEALRLAAQEWRKAHG